MTLNTPPPGPGDPAPAPGLRRIGDPATMRALAHPVRLALLEALARHEPLTATEAGEVIGESPTTCSFHLRMLAKYGMVEEAGGARGRRRPWRRTGGAGFIFPVTDDDPQTSLAAAKLSDLVWSRLLERTRTVLASRPSYPAEWQAISSATESVAYVTQEEARQLIAELDAVVGRYQDRFADPGRRPADSLPLEILLFTYPLDAAPPGR